MRLFTSVSPQKDNALHSRLLADEFQERRHPCVTGDNLPVDKPCTYEHGGNVRKELLVGAVPLLGRGVGPAFDVGVAEVMLPTEIED
jgi:hypothetical protein